MRLPRRLCVPIEALEPGTEVAIAAAVAARRPLRASSNTAAQ